MTALYQDGAGLEDVLRLARGFQAVSVWRDVALDPEAIERFFNGIAEQQDAFALVDKGGFVGGVIIPLWFAPQVKLGVELFWYCENPGEGSRYRETFERWARGRGADTLQFSCMLTDREPALRRMYRRAGFEAVEIGFRKKA